MEKIVIFGTGKNCRWLLDHALHRTAELKIVAFLDHYSARWGTFLDGVEISSVEKITTLSYDFILVAAGDFQPIIDELVDQYDVCPNKLVVFDGNTLHLPEKAEGGSLASCLIGAIENWKYLLFRSGKEKISSGFSDYFKDNDHRVIDKWLNYFEVYDTYFQKYREKPVKILEIGVFKGGSLQMWKQYFGKQALIVGVDINEACVQYQEEQIEIRIGSQEDRGFLKELIHEFGEFDIILDDGGHRMTQQITTFEETFPALKEGGVYVCEDLHTSYWDNYGGGYESPESFIEYTKKLVDCLNGWHNSSCKEMCNEYTQSIYSLHYYDSMVVILKQKHHRPCRIILGTPEY